MVARWADLVCERTAARAFYAIGSEVMKVAAVVMGFSEAAAGRSADVACLPCRLLHPASCFLLPAASAAYTLDEDDCISGHLEGAEMGV
jgi:hypothetical protein